jgi:hypothetical protein
VKKRLVWFGYSVLATALYPAYVLWYGLREAPGLASEIRDGYRAVWRGRL